MAITQVMTMPARHPDGSTFAEGQYPFDRSAAGGSESTKTKSERTGTGEDGGKGRSQADTKQRIHIIDGGWRTQKKGFGLE